MYSRKLANECVFTKIVRTAIEHCLCVIEAPVVITAFHKCTINFLVHSQIAVSPVHFCVDVIKVARKKPSLNVSLSLKCLFQSKDAIV